MVARHASVREELSKVNVNPSLDEKVQNEVWEALYEFEDCFAASFSDMESTPLTTFSIELRPGVVPRKCARLRRFSPKEREFIDHQLDMLSEAGFIRWLDSCEWLSPIVVAPKKGPCPGDDMRFCIGYGALNDATVDDKYPLPNVNELMDNMAGFAYYSILDGFSGYYSIKLDEKSIPLTAFLTPRGIAGWTVLPFGLKNAPPAYMRVMDQVMAGLPRTGVFVDDVGRGSREQCEIPADIRSILERIRSAKLKLKPRKCRIGYSTVNFVGHVLSSSGMSMQADKVSKVVQMAAPSDKVGVRAFLGLAGYYRRFIRAFADVARPLTAMLSSKTAYKWGKDEKQSFEALKSAVATGPILKQPDFDAARTGVSPFLVDTDASDYALGGVLSQVDSMGNERPIYFHSRKFSHAEANYTTTEREGLAVVSVC